MDGPLDRLLCPLEPSRFFAESWGRRSLHIPGDDVRCPGLGEEHWSSWLDPALRVDAAHQDAAGAQVQAQVDPTRVREAFAAGKTICADVSSLVPVAAVLEGLTQGLRPFTGAPFAKLYASPSGAGFAPHFDGFHVFVVQVLGKKRWRYGDAPALPGTLVGGKLSASGEPVHTYPRDPFPILGPGGRPIPAPDPGSLLVADLSPGDLLYLPPGTWHATEALGESVALSISPPRTPVAQLVLDALRGRLEAAPMMLADLVQPPGTAAVPAGLLEAIASGHAELQRAMRSLSPDALALHWAREAFAGAPTPPATQAPLADDTPLRRAPGGFTSLIGEDGQGGDALFIFRPGVELELPARFGPFIAKLAATDALTVAEAARMALPDVAEDVPELLSEFVAAGLLIVTDTADTADTAG